MVAPHSWCFTWKYATLYNLPQAEAEEIKLGRTVLEFGASLCHRNITFYLKTRLKFRACSHGGGGPREGEVPRLPVVEKASFHMQHPGHWGEV